MQTFSHDLSLLLIGYGAAHDCLVAQWDFTAIFRQTGQGFDDGQSGPFHVDNDCIGTSRARRALVVTEEIEGTDVWFGEGPDLVTMIGQEGFQPFQGRYVVVEDSDFQGGFPRIKPNDNTFLHFSGLSM